MAVCDEAFYTTTTTMTATMTRTTAADLYGYLNTFTMNSQERPLESRSRHAAPSLSRARLIRPSFHLFTA